MPAKPPDSASAPRAAPAASIARTPHLISAAAHSTGTRPTDISPDPPTPLTATVSSFAAPLPPQNSSSTDVPGSRHSSTVRTKKVERANGTTTTVLHNGNNGRTTAPEEEAEADDDEDEDEAYVTSHDFDTSPLVETDDGNSISNSRSKHTAKGKAKGKGKAKMEYYSNNGFADPAVDDEADLYA